MTFLIKFLYLVLLWGVGAKVSSYDFRNKISLIIFWKVLDPKMDEGPGVSSHGFWNKISPISF